MQEPALFRFNGQPVTVVMVGGDPWFVGSEVCRILGMADVTSALRVLDPDEKGPLTVRTLGGEQAVNGIAEPGFYKLVSRSRKPEAKALDRWVRHEVLPGIRRDGGYIVAAPSETPEELIARALVVAQAALDRTRAQLAEAQPKADALDRIATADGSLCITDAAKALQVRPKDLFDLLKASWIYKRPGCGRWIGKSYRVASGDLEHKVSLRELPDGSSRVDEQVRVTPKGLATLAKLLGQPLVAEATAS